MIVAARFGIFDVSGWNANVALELGIAIGRGVNYYIAFNPQDPDNPRGTEVPADLGGIDRIEYDSMTSLEDEVARVLAQEFGVPRAVADDVVPDPLATLRERVMEICAHNPNLLIGELASQLDATVDVAQVVIKPLVTSGQVKTGGKTKGRRYFVA